jgi:hypothetical protein
MSKHHQQNKTHSNNRVGTIQPSQPPSAGGFVPTNDDIQRRAYQIHKEKGGSDLENWLEAERDLKEDHHV